MADEKYKNEDPEEEKDNQFDDDEDFGLPDLEYDELDDDEDSELEDEPDFEEPVEEPMEQPSAAESSDEVVGEDELDEDVEINVDDIDDSETEDWEKELEKELEQELKAEGAGGFYEEESYEDFETTGEEIKDSVFTSDANDDFTDSGSEYSEPAAATGAVGVGARNTGGGSGYTVDYSHNADNGKGKFAKTVVLGTLAFALIAIILFFLWDGESGEPEKQVAKKEETTPPPKPVEKEPEPVQQEQEVEPVESQKPQPNNVTPGEVTLLEQQTGKTYVVIGSFFDGDMASDYANELASAGKSPMVIPPFSEYRFYRVAIAEFNNFKDAQASIDNYKNEYGQEVWPLRY